MNRKVITVNMLIGPLALGLRILMFNLAGGLAALGLVSWDAQAGVVAIDLQALSLTLAGLVTTAVTFMWSRIAKRKGGAT